MFICTFFFFEIPHVSNIIPYLSLWLTSLSMMFSRNRAGIKNLEMTCHDCNSLSTDSAREVKEKDGGFASESSHITVFAALIPWLLSLGLVVAQSLSHFWFSAHQASLSFTVSQSLLRFIAIESVMLSNDLILCFPLLLLLSVFPDIRVFSYESILHTGAKVLEF